MDKDNQKAFADEVKNYVTENELSSEAELPKIEFISDLIPYSKLPALYKSVNAFVLPSRGEGWGLPLAEAMSMGLPVIGTNWSGTTMFMNSNNSFLISVDALVPVETKDTSLEHHNWASPNQDSLRAHLRTVFEKKQVSKGDVARKFIREHFSVNSITELVLNKLIAIQPQLPAYRSSKEAKRRIEDSSYSTWGSGHTGSSWFNQQSNPPPSTPWGSQPSQTEFVDPDDGKKKWRIKIIND